MRPLHFRTACEADLDRLVEIHTSAFPDPRGDERRRRNFSANPLGPLGALQVALDGDAIVAHAFLFAFDVWFGGARVQVGAVATVGVAPEARGQGIAAALLDHLHRSAEARGDAITLLYPFRQGFYARHGYAPVTPGRRLAVHPAAFPSAWRARDPAIALRAASGADRDAIVQAYARQAARTTGWLARPDALWARLFQDERRVWLVAARDGVVVGYIAWTLAQAESHAETRLLVHEIAADDDPARRALLGLLGAQRDQVSEVALAIDADDPIDRALPGTHDVEHALGLVTGGPMVRLVDVARACEARGYASDGAVDLVVDGGAALHLHVQQGRATCRPSVASGPQIRLDRVALAAVLYGALRPSQAARLGWLAGGDASAIARADALFALPPYFALDTF